MFWFIIPMMKVHYFALQTLDNPMPVSVCMCVKLKIAFDNLHCLCICYDANTPKQRPTIKHLF